MVTRVLVCGGRNYNNYRQVIEELDILEDIYGELVIISGCASGADALAIRYAEDFGDKLLKFPADWSRYGRSAGPIRNQQMIDEGHPELVLAFPGGTGTKNMIQLARDNNIEVKVIDK